MKQKLVITTDCKWREINGKGHVKYKGKKYKLDAFGHADGEFQGWEGMNPLSINDGLLYRFDYYNEKYQIAHYEWIIPVTWTVPDTLDEVMARIKQIAIESRVFYDTQPQDEENFMVALRQMNAEAHALHNKRKELEK